MFLHLTCHHTPKTLDTGTQKSKAPRSTKFHFASAAIASSVLINFDSSKVFLGISTIFNNLFDLP